MNFSFYGQRRPNMADLVAGLCVLAGCGVMAWASAGYGIGSLRRMGAGYFPLALSLIGMGLGAAIAVRALLVPAEEHLPLRPRRLLFVSAAFVLFGLLIEPAGLLITIVAVTVTGSLADSSTRLHESLLLGIGLAVGIWLVFVAGLGLAIPLLPGSR